jgi:hypothetical protein
MKSDRLPVHFTARETWIAHKDNERSLARGDKRTSLLSLGTLLSPQICGAIWCSRDRIFILWRFMPETEEAISARKISAPLVLRRVYEYNSLGRVTELNLSSFCRVSYDARSSVDNQLTVRKTRSRHPQHSKVSPARNQHESGSNQLWFLRNVAAFSIEQLSNRLWRPIGLWDVEDPTCLHRRRTDDSEVVSLTRRPRSSPQKYFLVVIYVDGWVTSRAILQLERLGKSKNKFSDTENGTSDLPACSIVPQPTTLYRRRQNLKSQCSQTRTQGVRLRELERKE